MKITIIGAGNMGLAFSKSFLKYDIVKANDLHLVIRQQEKKEKIRQEFPNSRVSTFDEVSELDADLVIISVKPQDFIFTAEKLKSKIKENQMVLSIMAGISIEKIQKVLNHQFVVRAPLFLAWELRAIQQLKESLSHK